MRILSVDDNDENLYLIEMMARAHAHEVVSAHNGLEALEQLGVRSFDLIVSDVLMPGMDGFQLCRTVKSDERLKHIPFIFYTSTYTAKQDEELGLALGASRFIMKPAEPEAFLAAVEQVLREGESGSIPLPAVDLDDGGKSLSMYNQRLVRKLEHKIQQLEAVRTKLAASEEQLHLMWEGAMDGMRLSDRHGIILRANPALARMFAKPLDSLVGQPFTCCYGVDDPESILASYRDHVESRTLEARFETMLRRWDGEPIWVEGSNAMFELPSGPVVFSALRDVTRRKRSEQEQSSLEEQLRQAQKLESIGRLAGGVAHDFNNLLSVINGYTCLALEELDAGDPLHHTLSEVHKAGEQAVALTGQLLAFSRQRAIEPKPVDCTKLLSGNENMFQRLVGEDVQLVVRPAASSARVMADPGQLVQVLMNLAVNARDAMPGGGTLTMETAEIEVDQATAAAHLGIAPGSYVLLTVTDTGMGMSRETQQRIFDPFFTTKPTGKGTGLGLSTAYGIVRQCGGFVQVDSEPGRGARFEVYLPRTEGACVEPPVHGPDANPARGVETVLVVEDQQNVRDLACEILRRSGYTVLEAGNGAEALLICQTYTGPLHLVLTDVVMPGMNGPDLAHRIGSLKPGTKVLFMSGYTGGEIGSLGAPGEHVAYIQKPFTPESLTREVRGTLDAPSAPLILVADDSAPIRGIFSRILTEAGYSVVEAADATQTRERLRAGRIGLALIDLNMPGQEDLEDLRKLRSEYPNVRLVRMSAALETGSSGDPRAMGADAVLGKPVQPEVLLDAVRRLMAPQPGVNRSPVA
jgi:PAS domain S-box-containing protein